MSDKKPTVKSVQARVAAFLEGPQVEAPGGSWPVVQTEELHELYEIFGDIIALKYEKDCDGDTVLHIHITAGSRSRCAGSATLTYWRKS